MSSHPSHFKSKGGFGRVGNALRYSMQGLGTAIRHEAAFRQELVLAIVLAPCAFWVGQTAAQIASLLGTLFLVLIVELLNSAIEGLADAITLEPNVMIGRAKDLGSAAVFLSLIFSGLIWIGLLVNHWHPFF